MRYFLTTRLQSIIQTYPLISCIHINKTPNKNYITDRVSGLNTELFLRQDSIYKKPYDIKKIYHRERISRLVKIFREYCKRHELSIGASEIYYSDKARCRCIDYVKWPSDLSTCKCVVHSILFRKVLKMLSCIHVVLAYQFIFQYCEIEIDSAKFQAFIRDTLLPEEVFAYYLPYLGIMNINHNLVNRKFSQGLLKKYYLVKKHVMDYDMRGYSYNTRQLLPFHLLVLYQDLSCEMIDTYIQTYGITSRECWAHIKKFQSLDYWFVEKYKKYLDKV